MSYVKKFLCSGLAILFITPLSAYAVEETYDNYSDIPKTLRQFVRVKLYQEEYVFRVLQIFRRHADDTHRLSKEVINTKAENNVVGLKQNRLKSFVSADNDQNGEVDESEVRAAAIRNYNRIGRARAMSDRELDVIVKGQISHIMGWDTNKDGKVTYEEAATLSPDEIKSVTKNNNNSQDSLAYLALDPNMDGELTAIEIRNMAFKAFNTVDTNHDLVIGQDEYDVFKEGTRPLFSSPTYTVGRESPTKDECNFGNTQFPEDMKIYATGEYSGSRLGYQIDKSGHQAHMINLVVNKPNESVALILGAYEPTIWNIKYTPQTDIKAVVMGGYHKQVITGLDDTIPKLVSSFSEKGPCGYFYFKEDKLEKLNPISRRAFGKPTDMFYPSNNGIAVIGSKDYVYSSLISAAGPAPKSFRISDKLAGPQGLAQATNQGYLRRATPADARMWTQAYLAKEAQEPSMDLPPTAGGNSLKASIPKVSINRNAFVVLKKFEFPAGLYGAHMGTFIVPKGVPVPTGNPGHSDVYDMNTMTCTGPICGRR